jgi:proline dehydrogenase
LSVRVVKGQWPDPAAPGRDLRQGFIEVIEKLAGRARCVAVATHDMPLAARAIAILRAAGTPCELEQIYGMNSRRALRWARGQDVTLRLYIPFGRGYAANALGILKRNPRLAVVVAKSLLP